MRPLPLIEEALHRSLRTIESAQGPKVMLDGREVLLLCSNDYLGLAGDQRVRDAAAETAARWGAGAGGSPLVSGHMGIHRELEQRLAELKGTEACVLFGSGFLANTGVVAALASDGVVASDELNHASIVDGCRLARARTLVYPHGSVPTGADVIVTDAVFSMDGDVAPLAELVETGARVIVDEAHATGVIGAEGRGLVHELGLQNEVITIGTLGKALGSYGAFVCCDAKTADFLVNRARTLIYSTALPPPSIGAALARSGADGSLAAWGGCTRTHACCAVRWGSRSTTCRSSRWCSASRRKRSRAAPRHSRKASSPRPSARPRSRPERPACGSSPPPRTIRTISFAPAAFLMRTIMNQMGYSEGRREVVPTGGVRQHGR